MATVTNNAEIHVKLVGAEAAKAQIGGLGASLKSLAVTAVGLFGAVKIGQMIGQTMKIAYTEAEEAAKVYRKLAAQVEHTGMAAGYTADELKKMSEGFLTDLDADEITNKLTIPLLTFKKISGDVFKRTQQLALNMAEGLEKDIGGIAIQLGKALENPIKGLFALTKSGVAYSETEQQIIKDLATSNRLHEAQVKILEVAEGQIADLAKAGMTASGQLKKNWRDYLEYIGTKTAPTLNAVQFGIALFFGSIVSTSAEASETMIDNQNKAYTKISGNTAKLMMGINTGLVGVINLVDSIVTVAVGGMMTTVNTATDAIAKLGQKVWKGLIPDGFGRDILEGIGLPENWIDSLVGSFEEDIDILSSGDLFNEWLDRLGKNWKGMINDAVDQLNYIESNALNLVTTLKDIPDINLDDFVSGTGEMSEEIKNLTLDILKYIAEISNYNTSGSKLIDDINEATAKGAELIRKATEANLGNGIIENIAAAQTMSLIHIYKRYHDESLDSAKAFLLSETDAINAEYDKRIKEFNAFASDYKLSIKGLHDTGVMSEQEYQDELKIINEMINQNIVVSNQKRVDSFLAYNNTKREKMLEANNSELEMLKQLGLSYDQYSQHRIVQIEAEKTALLSKGVQFAFVAEWEKKQLNGLEKEYNDYLKGQSAYLESAQAQIDQLAENVKDALATGFGNAFADAIVEGENFAKSMQQLFKDLVRMILAELAKLAILGLFKSILGVATGGLSTGAGASPLGDFFGSGGYASIGKNPLGMAGTPGYMTPQINMSSTDARIDRLARIVEQNRPIVYTQVIEGVPFHNAVKRAETQALVM